MQTNRPYTYLVPERLTNQVEAGMRVIVPFGRGHREVQGFVVATGQTETTYQGALKELTALMDKSPVAFIRSMRLQRAAELLAEGGRSVAEVAEQTGFGSVGYFGRCFQAEFGCRPSDYPKAAAKRGKP